jgi:hypothetical protein
VSPPGKQRSRAWVAVGLAAVSALVGCHQGAGESGDVQPLARAGNASQRPRSIRLVAGGGIGFDDLLYSAERHAVLAPAGATGCVNIFDSRSFAKKSLCNLSASGDYAGGHGDGVTSADVGAGRLFAVDRTSQSLKVVELEAGKSGQAATGYPLRGQPDYVRWVEGRREVWVTEPDQEQIEVFHLTDDAGLTRTGAIAVRGGPESLVIDEARGRAYSHLWAGETVAIDLATHAIAQQFSNGCKGSRGIALNSIKGFLFAGCSEGKAIVLDIAHAGKILSTAETEAGVDIIAVNLQLNHLYVPAASDGSVAILGIAANGRLHQLGTMHASKGAHCVASDDRSRVWVCSPDSGELLVFDDTFPRTPE